MLLATTGLAVTPANAAAGDPFLALEIFPAEPMRVAAPLFPCRATDTRCKNTRYDNTAFPTYLPKPSLAQFVIEGKVTAVQRKAAGGPVLRWKIGTGAGAKWVFNRSGTRLDRAPAINNGVRALARRVAVNGRRALVADRITAVSATAPAAPASVEVAFLYTGTTGASQTDSATGTETWDVSASATSSAQFVVNGAEIEPVFLPAAPGDLVTVEYSEFPAAADGNTALEIFGEATATNRAPQPGTACAAGDSSCEAAYDQSNLPAGLPSPSWAQYVITGPVTEVVPGQRFRIGSSHWVFFADPSDTVALGGTVRAVVQRTTRTTGTVNGDGTLQSVPEPLVAEAIADRQAQTEVDVETAFLFSGLLQSKTATTWTVGGVRFAVGAAEIDPGLFVNDPVSVEYVPAGTALEG